MALRAVPSRDPVRDCYDPQCNCASSKREIVLHNQHVSKLSRMELENRFLRVYEENVRLKTDCHHLRDQLKRLSTRVFRLIESRKNIPYTSAGGFERQALNAEILLSEQAQHIATLQAENDIWRSKVESMRQQFLSCQSFTNYKPKNAKKCNSARRHEQWYLEEEIERLKETLRKMEKTLSFLRNGGNPDDSSGPGSADKTRGKGKAREHRSPSCGESNNKVRGRRSPSCGESNNKTDLEEERARVNSDVELIKAKRLLLAQAQKLTNLKERVTTIEQELSQKQQVLDEKTREYNEVSEQAKKNIDRIAELQHEIAEIQHLQQKVKDLSDQIHELKLERDELKTHNSQLVQLSTAAVSSSRSVASEDSSRVPGESLTALQLRVTTLETALGKEKEERLTAEISKQKERMEMTLLHQKNEELLAYQKELEERLRDEQNSSVRIEAHKKEVQVLQALKTELESKCQTLESKLQEKEMPCNRCLELEKELEAVKLQEERPLEAIYKFASLEEENSIVDLLRKIQKFQEQNGSSSSIDAFVNGRESIYRRYPTLNQTRNVLGLGNTKQDDAYIPFSESGQGDNQRNSKYHSRSNDSQPHTSTSNGSVAINASKSGSNRIADEKDSKIMKDSKPQLQKNHESTTPVTQLPNENGDKYLETVQELEKCQQQLRVQENINKLYREEIDALAKEIITHAGKYSCSPEN